MNLRRKIAGLAVAGALALAPSLAQAQYTTEPIYLALKAVYSHQMLDDFETTGSASGFNKSTGKYSGKDKTDGVFGGGIAIGYNFGALGYSPIRLELEYLHRGKTSAKYGNKTTANVPGSALVDYRDRNVVSSSHDVSATVQTVFANVYWDFPTDTDLTPYIGGGLGAAYIDAKIKSHYNMSMGHPNSDMDYVSGVYGDPNTGGGYNVEYGNVRTYVQTINGQQNCWNFAWNVGAGFAYQITPNVALDLNYRYSDFGQADFGTFGYYASDKVRNPEFDPNQPITNDNNPETSEAVEISKFSAKAKKNITSHEVLFGLRFTGY